VAPGPTQSGRRQKERTLKYSLKRVRLREADPELRGINNWISGVANSAGIKQVDFDTDSRLVRFHLANGEKYQVPVENTRGFVLASAAPPKD
jgi:hypothetical protein